MTHRILLFDSGMGGMTVARAVAFQLPDAQLVYAADNAGFPYGAWDEVKLVQRIVDVIALLIDQVQPDIVVIACNTASTIALTKLRDTFAVPFVGTVPAIKPAAALTKSGIIGVLATPGTVRREYTQTLIQSFAAEHHVVLHGASELAEMAEHKLCGGAIDAEKLRAQVMPVFCEIGSKLTDVIVLGCTHYPLIAEDIARVAPWPVAYIDPSAAIARRVSDVLTKLPHKADTMNSFEPGGYFLTKMPINEQSVKNAYAAMGFPHLALLDSMAQFVRN